MKSFRTGMKRSGTSPLAPGSTDTVEVQFGQPMKQPSLNHRHMSPAQEPPDSHFSPGWVVKLKMLTLPWLFRQGGITRPPWASVSATAAREAAKTMIGLRFMVSVLQASRVWQRGQNDRNLSLEGRVLAGYCFIHGPDRQMVTMGHTLLYSVVVER